MYRQELLFLCSARHLMVLYISMKFHENILNCFQVIEGTKKFQLSNIKGRITPKMYRQELRFLCSARYLMMLYISMKFHKKILNSFQLVERTQITIVEFQRGITPKMYRQEIWFLCSATRLMMLYISTKFHENILNCFQVIERTKNCHCQISKGNNSKTRVTVLVVCMSSNNSLYVYEVT